MLHTQIFEPFSAQNIELMSATQQSIYGEALARQIRYERYCYIEEGVAHLDLEPARQTEIHQTWTREILDVDVDNFQHNAFTALIGSWVCEQEGVDEATTELVVKALLVHDLKEYVLDTDLHEGDITYDEAQRRGEIEFAKEHAELGEILQHETELFGLDEATIDQIVAALNDSKLKPPQTQVGRVIELAERLGYVHSALRAMEVVVAGGAQLQQQNHLLWMCENVLSNQLPRLVELATRSAAARNFFAGREQSITRALAVLLDKHATQVVFTLYEDEGKDEAIHRLKIRDTAAEMWLDYAENQSILSEQ